MEWKMESQQLLEPTFLAPGVLDDKLSANSIKHISSSTRREVQLTVSSQWMVGLTDNGTPVIP